LRDFFREDNIFIAFGHEKHSIYDFNLTNDGTVLFFLSFFWLSPDWRRVLRQPVASHVYLL